MFNKSFGFLIFAFLPVATGLSLVSGHPSRNDDVLDSSKKEVSTKAKEVKKKNEIFVCPPGLWCKAKREFGYDSVEKIQGCPPGLWCRRKRNRALMTQNVRSTLKPRCPYGFCCVKKQTVGFENHETMVDCPQTLWCRKKHCLSILLNAHEDDWSNDKEEKKGDLKNPVAGTAIQDQRNEDCPPGLWCKRKLFEN